jgi:hypothetical protein
MLRVVLAVLVSRSPLGDTSAGESVPTALKTRIEQLAAGREVRVQGNLIAARKLLPERLRWVAQELRDDYLLVDIAGFSARLCLDGRIAWSSRVVVGRLYRKTPAFRATMRSIVLKVAAAMAAPFRFTPLDRPRERRSSSDQHRRERGRRDSHRGDVAKREA